MGVDGEILGGNFLRRSVEDWGSYGLYSWVSEFQHDFR